MNPSEKQSFFDTMAGSVTTRPHPQRKDPLYLLRGVTVIRPDKVWNAGITYIRLACGFAYRVTVID